MKAQTYILYNIWKIKGYGRKQVRYYEDYEWFNKIYNKGKNSKYWKDYVKGYRFTSKGWKEIDENQTTLG